VDYTTGLTKVESGYFSTEVNTGNQFGSSAFNGSERWLEIEVKCPSGDTTYTRLDDRQKVYPTPYAIYSDKANYSSDSDRLDGISSSGFFRTSGGTVSGNVDINGNLEAERLKVHNYVDVGYCAGMTSDNSNKSMIRDASCEGNQLWIGYNSGSSSSQYGGGVRIWDGETGKAIYAINNTVGIGLDSGYPAERLDVNGHINVAYCAGIKSHDKKYMIKDASCEGSQLWIGHNDGTDKYTGGVRIWDGEEGPGIYVTKNKVGIALSSGYPSETLDVNGTTKSKVVKISGGDLAEPFAVVGEPEPGTLVSIDPENVDQLQVSKKAYDRTVVGCVSGANGLEPGVIMYQDALNKAGNHPVALSGRVYCKADASYGAIQPGDLLSSSDNPGHVMVVKDYDRAQGAIIGKAMSALEEGLGLVLVLVTLQ
jgi:hypothetical protein